MIRRPIVDLSQSTDRKYSDENAAASLKGLKKGQTRRSVASKRRPNASSSRSLKSLFAATSSLPKLKVIPTKTADSVTKVEKEEKGKKESPGCRMILKSFRKRSCAVYESVITARTLGTLQLLFFRCLNYIDANLGQFIPKDSAEAAETSFFVHKLRIVADEFVLFLRRLEETDDAMMRLVHEFEVENSELFRHQLKWCCGHAVPMGDDFETPGGSQCYYMPPWDTAMVNRLEKFERRKEKMLELQKAGSKICEDLDKVVCENLSSVMAMMEKLSPQSKTGATTVSDDGGGAATMLLGSTSLTPHPCLLRHRDSVSDTLRHLESSSSSDLPNNRTTLVIPSSSSSSSSSSSLYVPEPLIFTPSSAPVASSPFANLHATPEQLSEVISTSSSSIDPICDNKDQRKVENLPLAPSLPVQM